MLQSFDSVPGDGPDQNRQSSKPGLRPPSPRSLDRSIAGSTDDEASVYSQLPKEPMHSIRRVPVGSRVASTWQNDPAAAMPTYPLFADELEPSPQSTREHSRRSTGLEDATCRPPKKTRGARWWPLAWFQQSKERLEDLGEEDVPDEYPPEAGGRHCSSRESTYQGRTSRVYLSVLFMSIYSTVLSGIWFVVAVIRPRWGRVVATSGGTIDPNTASVVCALLAKTIELTFVTVFISFLGQALTRRSFVKRSNGVTLAEMMMRNWVIQPGSLITHFGTLSYGAVTFLGVLTLVATLASMFYTTASDAMVSPKLLISGWERRDMVGKVRSTYGHPAFAASECRTPLRDMDSIEAGGACLNMQYTADSYRIIVPYLAAWDDIKMAGTSQLMELHERPGIRTTLQENVTIVANWVETENSNVTGLFEQYGRIINNVTLAMPHPGVYGAATDKTNEIIQPQELSNMGEYYVKASVVSPVVNVLCVNMAEDELAPLVYTAWPNAMVENTTVAGQTIGYVNWTSEIPAIARDKYLNRTTVDDIFRWGAKYQRRPPVFQLYPSDSNTIANSTSVSPQVDWNQPRRDAMYTLTKSRATANYTLCELRSWLSPHCSTLLHVSGGGSLLDVNCQGSSNPDAYQHSFPPNTFWGVPDPDWINMITQWVLSLDLNGGTYNNNASNSRILSQLILTSPSLNPQLPSMAEALAVLVSPMLIKASEASSFHHLWKFPVTDLGKGEYETFNASIRAYEYTSSHSYPWQKIFYIVLFPIFAINLICLVHLVRVPGRVTDFTEPQNLFTLAINSPPSDQVDGACGAGPDKKGLGSTWRVGHVVEENHYYFQGAGSPKVTGSDEGGSSGLRKRGTLGSWTKRRAWF